MVEGWSGVERAGEPLVVSTCTHTRMLDLDRPALHAYKCSYQNLWALSREISEPASALNGSVGAHAHALLLCSVCSGGTYFVAHSPPLMLIKKNMHNDSRRRKVKQLNVLVFADRPHKNKSTTRYPVETRRQKPTIKQTDSSEFLGTRNNYAGM